MKIIFPDFIDIPESSKEELHTLGVELFTDVPDNEAEIINRVKDAQIITANYIDITPNIIDNAPNLKCIIVPAVGFEWVDYKYARSKGIDVVNCPTHNSHAVAEHALALLFAVSRQMYKAAASLRGGAWEPKNLQGSELRDKELGILGYGRIGKDVATMAQALGMKVRFANSKSTDEEIDSLLKESDAVCLCLPLTDKTRHIVDKRRLELLKPEAILINVGRGATVDQQALLELLKEKRVAGAGLDVFDAEPLNGAPSDAIVELANLDNVVATPHIAYNTTETAKRLGEELLANLQSCIDGDPVNVVNADQPRTSNVIE